jgi:hypothetical protein
MGARHHRRRLEKEGRTLVERLGGRWTASGGMCRCPAQDDRTPSLSVRPGTSRLLFHCFAGCDASDVLHALAAARLLEPSAAIAGVTDDGRPECAGNAAALRIWQEARSLEGTPAAAYLSSRGLFSGSPKLRFHPRAPHGPQPLTRYRPALIAAVRDDSGLVGIQRTFLDHRSANRRLDRCGLGPFGSGAVRLGGIAPRLGLAEGIETALSASALFGVPCWATLGTERFGLIALPPEVDELLLFLDHDRGGRRAEMLASRTFAHGRIEARYPNLPGEDWNDVLCSAPRATRLRADQCVSGANHSGPTCDPSR